MKPHEETACFNKMKSGDPKAFEMLFLRFYGPLCLFAAKIVGNGEAAEEIVQGFFVKLWERKANLVVETSVKNYFLRSVKNGCINFIKHSKTKDEYAANMLHNVETHTIENAFFEVGLKEKIEESLGSLPPKRREIFRLSREEGLKYREIAERLNVSVKTVETQMGLAIRSLRVKLRDYLNG